MMLSKQKIGLAILLTVGLLGVGVTGGLVQGDGAEEIPKAQKKAALETKSGPAPKAGPTTMKKMAGPARLKQAPLTDFGLNNSEDVESLGALRMLEKLNKPVSLDKGIDRNTPLKDALEFLSDRFDVTILVDNAAFKAEGIDNVEDLPVGLPRMTNVPLRTILKMLTAQTNGAYLIKPDGLEVTTRGRSRPEDWINDRRLPALVTVSFTHLPLDKALAKLSTMTGVSVLLDERVAHKQHGKGQTNSTAAFNNVPLDTAVRLLADMNNLGAVAIDSVLYVTSKDNAETLQLEQEARRQKMHEEDKKPTAAPKQTKSGAEAGGIIRKKKR